MKRFLVLVFCGLVLIGLSGCGSSDKDSGGGSDHGSSAIVVTGDINESSNSMGFAVYSGIIKNTGRKTAEFVEINFTLKDANGVIISQPFDIIQSIGPGEKAEFVVRSMVEKSRVASYTYIIEE